MRLRFVSITLNKLLSFSESRGQFFFESVQRENTHFQPILSWRTPCKSLKTSTVPFDYKQKRTVTIS